MPDVDFLVDTLEVADVVEQSIVEHLDDVLDKRDHLCLMWLQLLGLGSELCKLVLVFLLQMLECASEPVHAFE